MTHDRESAPILPFPLAAPRLVPREYVVHVRVLEHDAVKAAELVADALVLGHVRFVGEIEVSGC